MIEALPGHLSIFQQTLLSQSTSTRMLMACGMGSIIGWEREWRHKASGLRTNILICMGSALFTIMSTVLNFEPGANHGQVASNVVQGIGFLGAGMILHSRSRVLGLTSAATVWAVAAIGMACGAGLYLVAAVATLLVVLALYLIGLLEYRAGFKRYPMLYEVRGVDEDAMFAEILAVLDREHIRLDIVDREKVGVQQRVTFALLASRRRHQHLLQQLNASSATDRVVAYNDEEED